MEQAEFIEAFGKNLSPQQRKAVCSTEGSTLLLAVPGSGKTTVLVTRLGYMVCCRQIPAGQILTITFSNAAAEEMRQRFRNRFGGENGITFCTINSLCLRIITDLGRMAGRPPFQMLEEGEGARLVRQIYQQVNKEFATESMVKDVQAAITYIKNRNLSPEQRKEQEFSVEHMEEIYQKYNQALREMRKMDFDDQLLYAFRLLSRYPELLNRYRNRFRYLLVDEAQDTSKIQHQIIRLLAGRDGNLFMVGDEDQSIYGFRGACPEALLSFREDYDRAEILTMEQNFRSTQPIIACAGSFIAKNVLRYEKKLLPVRGPGAPVNVISLRKREHQYRHLAQALARCSRQTAVLYRNNDSVLPLVDLLERQHIPYNCLRRETGFFTHRMVTDFTDIIRFSADPMNTELFSSLYYKIGLRINRETARKVCALSRSSGDSVMEVLLRETASSNYLSDNALRAKTALERFGSQRPMAILDSIWYLLDYKSYAEKSRMDTGKYSILMALAQQEKTVFSFLERLKALETLMVSHENRPGNLLTLSTVHSAKGLEFDRVFLLDVIDGILPMQIRQDAEDLQQYEEDRRVFYVAVTRAKNELNLFSCEDSPSEFIREVQKDLSGKKEKPRSAPRPKAPPITIAGNLQPKVGMELTHRKLGPGRILTVEGDVVKIWLTEKRCAKSFLWKQMLKDGLLQF